MAYQLPNGSTFDFASGYTPFFTITAISRATDAVVTAPGHTFTVGQVVMIRSGWWDLDGRAFNVSARTTTTFTLQGADTTDTERNPTGSVLGNVRGVTTWQRIPQILSLNLTGGTTQYTTFSPSGSGKDVSMPTTKSASTMEIGVADDPEQTFFKTIETASRTNIPQVQRLNLNNGSYLLYCTMTDLSKTPSVAQNEIMTRTIYLALQGDSTRYGGA